MSIRKSITISLIPGLLADAKGLLATARYGTIGDVMRTALRGLEDRELDFQTYCETKEAPPGRSSLKKLAV